MINTKGKFGGVFEVKCYDKDGNLKWNEEFPNLVVNTGLQFINEQVFKGLTYTATWYMGLTNTGATYAATDTMVLHPGWTENTSYIQSTRPVITFNSPTSADPSVIDTIAVNYTINATATIAGAFITTSDTKGGTAGTLFSAGNFTVGDRGLVSGDTLNVTYTFSADAV
jgi:hypothetical protein